MGALQMAWCSHTDAEMPVSPSEDEAVDAPIRRSRSRTALRIFNVVMLVVAAALWWILRNHSWATLAARLASIGLVSVLVLAVLDALAMCFDAAARHTFMRPEAGMVSYWRVLGAQASARSIQHTDAGCARRHRDEVRTACRVRVSCAVGPSWSAIPTAALLGFMVRAGALAVA